MSVTKLRERVELFVLRVVRLVDALPERELFSDLKTSLLQSATGVGSRFLAACRAEIPEEFVRRIEPVQAHLEDSIYWLELLVASRMADPERVGRLKDEAGELLVAMSRPEPDPPAEEAAALEDVEPIETAVPQTEAVEEISEHARVRVLLATDVPSDAGRVIEALQGAPAPFGVELVSSMEEMLEALREDSFDVALVELSLPDAEGAEVVERLRQEAPALPIILLVSESQTAAAEEAVRRGAQDYFVKRRVQRDALTRSIRFAIRLKQSEFLARHDSLTGLPNRTFLEERLSSAVAQARRSGDSAAVLFFDLDNFKEINDRLGHEIGDELLRSVAKRLSFAVRETDTVARLGGDEFVLVLTNLESPLDVTRVAEKIVEDVARPHQCAGHSLEVRTSIGISMFPDDSQETDGLLRRADAAMYESKKQGGNQFHFADSEMDTEVFRLRSLRSELHQALDREELLLYYQPQLNLGEERVGSVEVLLRWDHPREGLLTPDRFLPTPQDPRFMVELLQWVLERAYRDWPSWNDNQPSRLAFSVNLHNHRLNPTPLLDAALASLSGSGFDPRHLIVELTEESLYASLEESATPLRSLTEAGVRLTIDDFGSGHFSVADLARLPIHSVKMPQQLIHQMMADADQAQMVETIITLAHKLNLMVVGKGVETAEQFDFLAERRCDEIQGFYFARPMDRRALVGFLDRVRELRGT